MSPAAFQPEVHELVFTHRPRAVHERRKPVPEREGAGRHHRRRQLRQRLRPGRPPLPRRQPGRGRPRPDARRPRRLPRPRHRVLGRVRHRRRQGRQGPLRGDLVGPEQHDQVHRRHPAHGHPGPARHDARRPRQVPQGEDHQGRGLDRRHRRGPQGDQDRRRRLLPARRLRAGDQVVRRADPRGRLRLRELHPGVHRPRGLLEQPLQEGRPADRRRRHQVPGRRDDRAPLARPPVRRPRREAHAHLPAQRGRQHGLLQHARARAAGVQEDLQDQRGDVDHGARAPRRRRLHRPLGLRAVADRPQVGAHPPRGPGLRRRAADRGDEARGLGLPELGRHRHRRRALLQAGHEPRHRRPDRRPELLPHEVAVHAAARRPGPRGDRGVHRQAREDARRGREGPRGGREDRRREARRGHRTSEALLRRPASSGPPVLYPQRRWPSASPSPR